MLRLVRSTVVVLDKMVQLNHTDALICVSRWGDSNNLMPSYILIKPRHYNHYSRHDNYRWYCFTIYRYTLNDCKRHAVLRYPYIHLLNPNWYNHFLSCRYANPSSLLIYIVYLFPMLYACSFKCWPILCLKPFAEGLLGIHVDMVARNRLRLNRMELGGAFQPGLEPLLRWD
jgi:hypothetical protein